MVAVFEPSIIAFAGLLDFFGRLAFRPFSRPLWSIHHKLDANLLERPGLFGNLWRLFHEEDWQKSSRFNARVWVVAFAVFYLTSTFLGQPWKINLAVTLGFDGLTYFFHKKRLWARRKNGFSRSYALWAGFWWTTFILNMTAAWLLLDQLQLDKGLSKVLLGTVGVLVNPLVFRFRDKVALKDCAVSKPEEMLTPLPKIDVTRAPRVL